MTLFLCGFACGIEAARCISLKTTVMFSEKCITPLRHSPYIFFVIIVHTIEWLKSRFIGIIQRFQAHLLLVQLSFMEFR